MLQVRLCGVSIKEQDNAPGAYVWCIYKGAG